MELLTCSYCQSETPAEYNFCVVCNKQIKCLNRECGKLLIAGKDFCFACGQSLAVITPSQGQTNRFVQTVTQQGKNYSSHVEFHASDHAVLAFAPFLAGQINSPPRRAYEVSSISSLPKAPKALPPSTTNTEPTGNSQPPSESAVDPSINASTPPVDVNSGAGRLFTRDGEKLVAVIKDYKGKTWAEQQRNFILLYVSAHFQHYNKPASKDTIRSYAL
jgi:hypothetical protein